jgi:uroporphyrinogen decarboxylase
MNDRERFLSVLQFEKPDVFPAMEFMGYWPEVQLRWSREGLGEADDIHKHFGLVQPRYIPIDFNFVPPFEVRVIEETDWHMVMTDEQGCTKKIEKNSSAMPHYIDFPVKDRHSFETIKERLNPFDTRYPAEWDSLVKQYACRDYPLGLLIRGPFAFCRDFVMFDRLMMMVYDDINLIRDMMNFQVDFTIKLWDKVVRDIDVDFVYLGEDMAYKNGPMFSPDTLNELVAPLYRRLSDFFKSNGIRNFILDSDGCVLKLLPMYIENGVTGILPVERVANMDPVKIRKEYPKLQMIGGVDKLKIAEGGAAIDSEIAKIQGLVNGGGYIPSFDHSVPPIVSYGNYETYMNKLKKILANGNDARQYS